jgi:outer membrane protein
MKNNKPLLIVIVLFILMTGVNIFLLLNKKTGKQAFINTQEVFKNFSYKKELEQKLKTIQTTRQNIMDSLQMELKVLAKQLQLKKGTTEELAVFQAKKESFFQKKNQFEQDNEKIVKEFDAQILKQLNQYVTDYGQQHGYKYIFGTDGSGNLMYADETESITNDVIAYINERYKGGVK